MKKIAPDGWRVPNNETDIPYLLNNLKLDDEELRDALLDTLGFSADMGGHRNYTGTCEGDSIQGLWWTTTLCDTDRLTVFGVSTDNNTIIYLCIDYAWGYSVRCIRDWSYDELFTKMPLKGIIGNGDLDKFQLDQFKSTDKQRVYIRK